jgi:hypothetical protein
VPIEEEEEEEWSMQVTPIFFVSNLGGYDMLCCGLEMCSARLKIPISKNHKISYCWCFISGLK